MVNGSQRIIAVCLIYIWNSRVYEDVLAFILFGSGNAEFLFGSEISLNGWLGFDGSNLVARLCFIYIFDSVKGSVTVNFIFVSFFVP